MERVALSLLLGYVLGSIPTAYLFVRWKSRLDIREHGSGNVGTLNSYEVSGSKVLALVVLGIDLAKGAVAALMAWAVWGPEIPAGAVAGVSAVLGHNYPVWLRFRGGRGLAPAAGAALVVFWGVVPLWLLSWAAGFSVLRAVNPANAVACTLVAVTVAAFPALLPGGDLLPLPTRALFAVALMAAIALRLIEPVRAFVLERKNRRNSS